MAAGVGHAVDDIHRALPDDASLAVDAGTPSRRSCGTTGLSYICYKASSTNGGTTWRAWR